MFFFAERSVFRGIVHLIYRLSSDTPSDLPRHDPRSLREAEAERTTTVKKMIKTISKTFAVFAALTAVLSSCAPDDGESVIYAFSPNYLVTVKSADDGTCFLQLDERTVFFPDNIKKSPFKGRTRALASLSFTDEADVNPRERHGHVFWLDSILTKKTVMSSGTEDALLYGSDPIEIVDSWVTVVEDGYLTLQVAAQFSDAGIPHHINLLTGVDDNDPYVLELRHDAKGDYSGCRTRHGIVAFDISGLPDTGDETVKLTVRYGPEGSGKVRSFDYRSGVHDDGRGDLTKACGTLSPEVVTGLSIR